MYERQQIDFGDYVRRTRTEPCFICRIVAGELPHHVIYEDESAIVFLNKYPTLYGYTLVAPRQHREQVSGDFSLDEYLALQHVIYRVAEALRLELQPARVYILSLGSQQANRHVHWHIAPLPSGVPYEEQQFEALRIEKGVLALGDEETAALAARVQRRIEAVD